MVRYMARRVIVAIPTLIAMSLLVFAIMRVLPGDVSLAILADTPHTVEMREALRRELGLEEPLPAQYARWAGSMLDGSFGGRSLETGEPISAILAEQLSVTLLLAVYAVVLSLAVALPLGVAAGLHRGRALDRAIEGASRAALSVPTVFAALLVMWLLLRLFGWSPPIIYEGPADDPATHIQMVFWPALLLAAAYGPHLVRVTRTRLIDVLDSDYAESARARGLTEAHVVLRHALPNALVAAITVAGVQLGALVSGAIVVETVFGLPGIGRGIVHAALARDYPVVQSIATILVALVLAGNLAVDLLYSFLDPRVRYDGRRM